MSANTAPVIQRETEGTLAVPIGLATTTVPPSSEYNVAPEPDSASSRIPGRAPSCQAWPAGMTHSTQSSGPHEPKRRPSSAGLWSAFQARRTMVVCASRMDKAQSFELSSHESLASEAESLRRARIEAL